MPLSQVNLNAVLSWALQKPNVWNSKTTEGPDSQFFNLNGINTTTYNQLFAQSFTVAASGSQTVDLTNVTNLVCETVTFTQALTLFVTAQGATCLVSPGASNGLTWWGSGTVTIPAGGCFVFSDPVTGPGATVTTTAKNLTFSNPTASTGTFDIVILGKG